MNRDSISRVALYLLVRSAQVIGVDNDEVEDDKAREGRAYAGQDHIEGMRRHAVNGRLDDICHCKQSS
jgi:hypothetical protein